jgi:C-terminal processing protease CtpA/Prc
VNGNFRFGWFSPNPDFRAFKAGHGCFLGLPIATYLTWQGRMIEGSGISPAVPIELDFDALMAGGETQDNQKERALEVARIM